MNWPLLKKIALYITGWRILLFLIGAIAPFVFPFKPSYPYYETLLKPLGADWLVKWAGFDGVHYLTIISKGYVGTGLIQAFFPVYPILLRVLSWVMNPIVAGLLLSHLALIGAMYVWVQIFVDNKIKTPWWQLCLPFLLFPTSLFFGAVYTESVFLFLVLLCYWYMKRGNMFLATVCTAIASATRVVGVVLVPMMITYLMMKWMQVKANKTTQFPWKNLSISFLGTFGLIAYMIYLFIEFHDPLYFLHVQAAFGGGRQENFILLPQVLFRYMKIFLTPHTWTWSYYAYLQECVLTLIFLTVLFWLTINHWRAKLAEMVYSWLIVLIPPLTGTFQSMPRYMLMVFPVFIAWTELRPSHPKVFWSLCVISTVFLVLNILLFMQGYWVA